MLIINTNDFINKIKKYYDAKIEAAQKNIPFKKGWVYKIAEKYAKNKKDIEFIYNLWISIIDSYKKEFITDMIKKEK